MNSKPNNIDYAEDSILFLFDPGSIQDEKVKEELLKFTRKISKKGIPIVHIYYVYKGMDATFCPFASYELKIKTRKYKPVPSPYKLIAKSSRSLFFRIKTHKLETEVVSKEYFRKAADCLSEILRKTGKDIVLVAGQTADGCQRDFLKFLPKYMENPPHLVFFPTLSQTLDEDRKGASDSAEERVKKWIGRSKRKIFTRSDIIKEPEFFLNDV
ncbi:MAG: hypothetical protein R6U26_02700 [Candidatus Undinarchaeales archaeon]